MASATDAQVQRFVNERVRVRSEQIRALYLACKDDKGAIDDVYAALTQQSPTWTDNRTDGPPHLLVANDVLAWNAFISSFISFVEGDGGYAKVLQACVRSIGS